MDKPEATLDEIMNVLPAPDFPTGGRLIRNDEIRAAYETGRGKLTLRAKVHIEDETPPSEDPEERLRKLRELYDQRLITEEEYEAKRREILGEL